MIVARDLVKRFDAESVIDGLQARISAGEFVGIVGPSGCGKSTFLRLIAGLESPSAGELSVHGGGEASASTAFVFQDPQLLPWRNVEANVRLPLELSGTPRRQQNERTREALDLVGLGGADGRKLPKQLSGGMRMRVSFARALVTQPRVMLMDEPFAALDDLLRQQLNDELSSLWRQQRWTGVFVTHHVAEAVFLSERVLVMSARPGRFVDQFDVPFEHPRIGSLRADDAFVRLVERVAEALRTAA